MNQEVKRIYIPEEEPPLLTVEEVKVEQTNNTPRYVGCEGKLIIASGEDAHVFH